MRNSAYTRVSLALVLLGAAALSAEAQSADATQPLSYMRGKVIVGGTHFDAENVVFARDSVTFTVRGTGERKAYAFPQIEYATRETTHGTQGTLFGGGLMLLSGLTAAAQIAADPQLQVKDDGPSIAWLIGGLTVGGAVIGGLIGSSIKDEKRVFQNGRFSLALGLPVTRQPANQSIGRARLGVSIGF